MKKIILTILTGLLPAYCLAEGTFLDWTTDDTTEMLGNVKDLITDLTPLLIPIIAVGLGLIIFAVIVRVIRKD